MPGERFPDSDHDVLVLVADVLGKEVTGTELSLRGAGAALALAEIAATTVHSLRCELAQERASVALLTTSVEKFLEISDYGDTPTEATLRQARAAVAFSSRTGGKNP